MRADMFAEWLLMLLTPGSVRPHHPSSSSTAEAVHYHHHTSFTDTTTRAHLLAHFHSAVRAKRGD